MRTHCHSAAQRNRHRGFSCTGRTGSSQLPRAFNNVHMPYRGTYSTNTTRVRVWVQRCGANVTVNRSQSPVVRVLHMAPGRHDGGEQDYWCACAARTHRKDFKQTLMTRVVLKGTFFRLWRINTSQLHVFAKTLKIHYSSE